MNNLKGYIALFFTIGGISLACTQTTPLRVSGMLDQPTCSIDDHNATIEGTDLLTNQNDFTMYHPIWVAVVVPTAYFLYKNGPYLMSRFSEYMHSSTAGNEPGSGNFGPVHNSFGVPNKPLEEFIRNGASCGLAAIAVTGIYCWPGVSSNPNFSFLFGPLLSSLVADPMRQLIKNGGFMLMPSVVDKNLSECIKINDFYTKNIKHTLSQDMQKFIGGPV